MSDATTARPHDMIFSGPPEFGSAAEERDHRKQRLAAALRVFALLGFDRGVAGHITVRDPEYADRFWVNPFGRYFGHMRASDLILVDHGGEIVEGDGILNTAAFRIHAAVHAARPDVVAAAHAHTTFGSAWSAMGRPLDPITNEACFFFEDHVVHSEHTGVTLEDDKALAIAQALGGHRAAILQHHGILTVGQTVDEAAWWFVAFEKCCEVQTLAEAAGRPTAVEPDQARAVRDTMGTPLAGWFSFQPLYQQVARDHTDLFD
jgi:ribulose-5-phosphate 4-epimerase/fuculose-1-phosphate aldolase